MAGGEGFGPRLAAAGFEVLRFAPPAAEGGAAGRRAAWQAAVAVARAMPQVRRIVLWGADRAGGDVLRVAAEDGDIAAVISLTPAVDGLASLLHALRGAGASAVARAPGRLRTALRTAADRPIRHASALRCPVLVQVADEDSIAPVGAAMRAAWKARADVRHYPCDHGDVGPGAEWFEHVLGHQLAFLRLRLA